jgi:hypothetical protein
MTIICNEREVAEAGEQFVNRSGTEAVRQKAFYTPVEYACQEKFIATSST